MPGFLYSNEPLRLPQSFCKIGWAADSVMCIGCEDLDKPLLKHSLSPIARAPAEPSGQRSGCELHPDPLRGKRCHHIVFTLDPRKPFGMGQDRNVTSEKNTEKKVFESHRCDVVGRFHQDVVRMFTKVATAEQSCKALSLRLSGTPPRGAVYPTGV